MTDSGTYGAIIVCPDLGDECACCGGSATLGGTQEAIPSPRGKALRYCSLDCHDEWEEHLDQQERARAAAWCPVCGYDQNQHAPECGDWLAHEAERAERPHLYDGLTDG